MSRDRIIQFSACVLALVCLGVSIGLIQPINEQRLDLQLGFNAEVGDQVPPKYVVFAAALGSFRGVAANILWYRVEMMKREGNFFQINDLSRWITALQPRFPQVWVFLAWNMAYNVSVETSTPAERWHWVNQGIRILREEGIVYNPRAVALYRELGWIFFHKFGQYTDDMNWYYKEQLAREWQEVLGAPTEGATAEQALKNFEPVADDAELYFVFNRPTREMYKLLESIAEQESDSPVIREQVYDLKHANLKRLAESLDKLEANLEERVGPYEAADRVRPIRDAVAKRMSHVAVDPLTLLYDNHPETRELVAKLAAQDISLNREGLREVGNLLMLIDYAGADVVRQQTQGFLSGKGQNILDLLTDEKLKPAWDALLPYWRAKVLVQEYHMDPGYMYILMERYGPLDWRHPAAHAVYWSALGVEVSLQVLDRAKIDILNTERQVIHGMQAMMYSGRISFDPFSGRLTTLPDPRFIPAYETALNNAVTRYEGGKLGTSGVMQSFEGGHENFLQKAVVYSWLYGDVEQARDYYDKLRRLYSDKPHNVRTGAYTYTLDDFVKHAVAQNVLDGEMVDAYQFIDAMIRKALFEGLANDRPDIFNQNIAVAQYVQSHLKKKRGYVNPNAQGGQERLLWGSFDDLFKASYVFVMRQPQIPLLERARVYRNTPNPIKLATYAQYREVLAQQCRAAGLDPAQYFPPPAGFKEAVDIEKAFEGVDSQGNNAVERK